MNDNNNYGFYSMDKLIEFGLGMTMARQMMKVMNESMEGMQTPATPKPLQQQALHVQQVHPVAPSIYYVCIDGKSAGPFNEMEITKLITSKRIDKDTLAWIPGQSQWEKIENIPAILRIVALTPPPLTPSIL